MYIVLDTVHPRIKPHLKLQFRKQKKCNPIVVFSHISHDFSDKTCMNCSARIFNWSHSFFDAPLHRSS